MRLFLILSIVLQAVTLFSAEAAGGQKPHLSVYFSPHGGCTEAVVHEVNGARRSILVEAYSFTSIPIAKSLITAKQRGVRVVVLLDKGALADRYSVAKFLHRGSVPVYIDSSFRIAHSKVMILDGTTVITGSFNFTKSAEKSNSENLLVISNAPDLAKKYTTVFQKHQDLSQPYSGHQVSPRTKHHPKNPSHSWNPFQSLGNFFHSLGL